MKIISVSTLTILIVILSSCIPSLHGIVTDQTRTTDDRIIGTWSYGNASAQAGSSEEESSAGFKFSQKELDYTFERAANITYKMPGTEQSNYEEGISRSMLPPVTTRISNEEILPYYIMTHRELINGDTIVSYFKTEMTQINQHLLLDFIPNPIDGNVFSGRFATNYILAHTFAKVEFLNGDLLLSPIDAEHIENLISQKRIRLKHERRGEEEIILTASTEELRAFLSNYSDDGNLFESADRLYPVNK